MRRIRSGLKPKDVGQPLTRQLPDKGVVDGDCTFTVGKKQRRRFRVIGMKVEVKRGGRRTTSDLWLVTNLPPEQVSAEVVAQMYRLRWNVENCSAFSRRSGVWIKSTRAIRPWWGFLRWRRS